MTKLETLWGVYPLPDNGVPNLQRYAATVDRIGRERFMRGETASAVPVEYDLDERETGVVVRVIATSKLEIV